MCSVYSVNEGIVISFMECRCNAIAGTISY